MVDLNNFLGVGTFGKGSAKEEAVSGDEFINLLKEKVGNKIHSEETAKRATELPIWKSVEVPVEESPRPPIWKNVDVPPEEAIKKKVSAKEFLVWKNGEIAKMDNKSSRLNVQDQGELPKSKSSESGDIPSLQSVLSIGSNEAYGGSADSNNGLDVLKLGDTRSVDIRGVIGKITDYLIQNGIKNLDSLEVLVDHEDLGRFKIDAIKTEAGKGIDLRIETMSVEGREFFQQNEFLLLKDLSRAGINIHELEIVESRDSVLSDSLSFKNNNSMGDLEKLLQEEKEHSRYGGEKDEKESPDYHSEEEEEDDGEYR